MTTANQAKTEPQIVPADGSGRALSAAVRALKAGDPVALPTETVYGLAADATNGEAVAKVFEMKGRPAFNPLICHVSGLAMAEGIARLSIPARRLASAFWPGPLTIVVPKRKDSGVHDLVTADLPTIAIRCPKGFIW